MGHERMGHGTNARYQGGCRCPDCREAKAQWRREHQAEERRGQRVRLRALARLAALYPGVYQALKAEEMAKAKEETRGQEC